MIFFTSPYKPKLISQVLKSIFHNEHGGSKKQKNRGEVSGGNSKPWAQKGTGRARTGSTRSPIFRGGGRVFAALGLGNPRHKINKKMYKGAFNSLISFFDQENKIILTEQLSLSSYRTADFLDKYPQFQDKLIKTIIVCKEDEITKELLLATRNLYYLTVISANNLDLFTLSQADQILLTEQALNNLQERLS
jgi:large subunit ribosomal protein L4